MQDVRTKLRAASVEFRVAKNTLAKRAIKDTDSESLSDVLSGPTAFAFSYDDPVAGARVLSELVDDHEAFEIKGGILGDKLLSIADILALAKLPTKEVLLGRVVGAVTSPLTSLVGTLDGIIREFIGTVDAIAKAKA